MSWPAHLPEGCPPPEAQEVETWIFRGVENNPPEADDFLSYKEEDPDKWTGHTKECQASGLSVFTSEADIRDAQMNVPFLEDCLIARARIEPGMGKLKHTPGRNNPNHYTFWPVDGLSLKDFFEVVEVI